MKGKVRLIILFIALLVVLGCGSDYQSPGTPTGTTIFNQTASSLSLLWNASSDNMEVAGYRIYRNGSPYITLNVLGFTDSGLSPDTIYCYQISAFDPAGNVSEFTDPSCGKTLSSLGVLQGLELAAVSIIDSTFPGSDLLNSFFMNTIIKGSSFINSGIINSTIRDCIIINSTIYNSPLLGDTLQGKTIINSTINNSPGLW